jgi:hypothetical protein
VDQLGSAVQLPEVFLKALSIAENLGHDPSGFSTANLDMVRHYRTDENVLRRPTLGKGRSFALTGHHEINVPLLAAAVGWSVRGARRLVEPAHPRRSDRVPRRHRPDDTAALRAEGARIAARPRRF